MFSAVTRMAFSSMSQAVAWRPPSSRAVQARMPLPQPTSRILAPLSSSLSSCSMHIRVVAWEPVPKLEAGSMVSSTRPSGTRGCSQLGQTYSRLPTLKGL